MVVLIYRKIKNLRGNDIFERKPDYNKQHFNQFLSPKAKSQP